MHTRKTVSVALTLFLFAVITAACGPDDDPVAPTSTEPVTIDIVSVSGGDSFSRATRRLDEQYSERYPHVEFKRSGMNNEIEWYLDRPEVADMLLLWSGYELEQGMAAGKVAGLSEVWERSRLIDAAPESAIQLSSHQGERYYVPMGYSWPAVYYNKAIFAQLGLEPPETWDEFLAICDALWNSGETPIAWPGDSWWESALWFDYLNVRLNGGEFHRQVMRGEVPLDDSRIRDVFQIMNDLVARGYVIENPMMVPPFDALTTVIRGDGDEPLSSQKAVMVFANLFWVSELPPVFQNELDYFQFPAFDPAIPRAEVIESIGYVVPAGAADGLAAQDYLAWLSSLEAQSMMAQLVGDVPGFVTVRPDVDTEAAGENISRGIALALDADDVVHPFLSGVADSQRAGLISAMRSLLRQSSDVDTILAKWEEKRQQAIEKGEWGVDN